MIAATIYVLLTGFNYVSNVGLSSRISVTAQNSIYQTLAMKDYIIQQANYNFQVAQLLEGIDLAPVSVSCGYINTSSVLPFIGVPKIYYWRNANGQMCLPNNQKIVLGVENLLNQLQYAAVNSTNITVTTNLVLNLSSSSEGTFSGNFSTPALPKSKYLVLYNRSNSVVSICKWNGTSCHSNSADIVFNGTTGTNFRVGRLSFTVGAEQDTVSGGLAQSVATNAFFANSGVSPAGQFTLVTFPSGTMAVIYSTISSGSYEFELTPLLNQNAYSLTSAKNNDVANGQPGAIPITNNSDFTFDGVKYHFIISSDVNGAFEIYPVNYAMVPLQPNFVYYKYLPQAFQTSGTQNLLFPNNQNLYVSFYLFPLYNAQVCLSYNEVQFTVQNCMSLAGTLNSQDYMSELMQLGTSFVNQSFPLGDGSIQGFAQYTLDNYLSNVVKGVNLKTVSVNGHPMYDWYSALILALGSPQGTDYLLTQLNRVKEPYYGEYIYNCSQNSSDMRFCRNLLSTTLSQDIKNLFENTIPQELTFLSGYPFNINVMNLSVTANESSSCQNYTEYTTSARSGFYINNTAPPSSNYTEEILGIPISINFGYQNSLYLQPNERCGIQNSPYQTSYPGFTEALVASSQTYLNCAQIPAMRFLNDTCIAALETTNSNVATYIDQSSANGGHQCQSVKQNGNTYYSCPFYNFTMSSYRSWIISRNSCPEYVVVDGENFTSSSSQYTMVSVYGGGVKSVTSNYDNWTVALINGSLGIPSNFSLHIGFELSGPNPSLDAIMSTSSDLQGGFSYVSVHNSAEPAAMYNYSSNGKVTILSTSTAYSAANSSNNMIINRYCTPSICNASFSVNSFRSSSFSVTGNNYMKGSYNLLGVATGSASTSDLINYMFLSNYVPGYSPISSVISYSPASTLNSRLNSSFGLTTDNNTFYNQILLNQPPKVSGYHPDYQMSITLDQNFNSNELSAGQIEIFGYSSSDSAVQQLYWWNQTQIGPSAIIWINLNGTVPNSIYIVYGQGVASSAKYAGNGDRVFPLFVSNGTKSSFGLFNFLYPINQKSSLDTPTLIGSDLNITDMVAMPPYVYNSTLTTYYSQFACISTSPSFQLTLLNATYSPYPVQFNINSLYNTPNPLYPGLAVIGEKVYSSWPS